MKAFSSHYNRDHKFALAWLSITFTLKYTYTSLCSIQHKLSKSCSCIVVFLQTLMKPSKIKINHMTGVE